TDGGGSVRIPAAFCGLVGFKPSFGRVPETPGFPGWDGLTHTGPLTRTVRDAALVLDAIAGPDDRDRASLPAEPGGYLAACDEGVRGLNVAWAPDLGYAAVDDRVLEIAGDAAAEFEALGCHVEVVNPGWEDPDGIFATIVAAQFHAAWADQLPAVEDRMDGTLVRFIRLGAPTTAPQYIDAWRRVDGYWREVAAFLERFDLLLTPTTAVPPFPAGGRVPREIAGREVSVRGWMPFTFPFNLTGQPAISVPAGWTEDGLPVGLQIVGRRHADRTVLAAAAAYEAACPWQDRRPPS
ncbi:MAG TPA: amidase family protein, partial [Candidatus Tectomicrobia bacterium]|nr:amidase family protein [Candidatus Tectomicrobia bacterium]